MLQPGKNLKPLPPAPPKATRPLPPKPAPLKESGKPAVAPPGGQILSDSVCPKCKATCIASPMRQLRVCSACGHQWPMGPKTFQRPVSRADLMGVDRKHGTPFRF